MGEEQAQAMVAPSGLSGQGVRWKRKAVLACVSAILISAVVLVVSNKTNVGSQLAYAMTPSRFPTDIFMFDNNSPNNQHTTNHIANLLQFHHLATRIHLFSSLTTWDMRSILWKRDNHVIVFPASDSYYEMTSVTKTDLRAFVGRGNVAIFLGDYKNIGTINDIFGTNLAGEYVHGPYYRNPRTVRGTPFQYCSRRVEDVEPVGTVGINGRSLPLGGRSLFDTRGASAAIYFPYHRGVIVYLGAAFTDWIDRHDPWVCVLHQAMRM